MKMMINNPTTSLFSELKQGKELANQLKNHLDPITSLNTCEELLQKIVSTYDKAISILHCNPNSPTKKRNHHFSSSSSSSSSSSVEGNGFLLDQSSSLSTDSSTKDHHNHHHQDYHKPYNHVFKKRKTQQPKWSEQVRVCSGNGIEGSLVDGHSWRKYGQKDILGAKFPRAYYRCTYRNTRGCLATKLVQRTDENSSIFEVTYKGRHTCIQSSTSASKLAMEIPSLLMETEDDQKQGDEEIKAEPEDDSMNNAIRREEIFPFFSFPFTQTEQENLETKLFSLENDLGMGCFYHPSPFLPEISSDSDYDCKIEDFIICSIMEKSESEVPDSTATPTSVTNSPFGDLEISFDQGDFDDPNFPLDNLGFS